MDLDLDERWMRRISARMRDEYPLLRAMDATDEAIDRREELVRRTSIESSRRGDGRFILEGRITDGRSSLD